MSVEVVNPNPTMEVSTYESKDRNSVKVEISPSAKTPVRLSAEETDDRVQKTKFMEERRGSTIRRQSKSHNQKSAVPTPRCQPLDLEPLLTLQKLAEFEQKFTEVSQGRSGIPVGHGLDMYEFRRVIRGVIGRHVTDEDADTVFWKVDVFYKEAISWQDYMNYLKVMTGVKQGMAIRSREPYSRDIHYLKATSNLSTVDVLFMPTPKRSPSGSHVNLTESAIGKYIVISQDGIITTWNSGMKHSVVQQIDTPNCPTVSVLVTCSTFMPAANVLVIATSNCDLIFYTYSSGKFQKASRISQIPATITCITYHCDRFHRDRQSYLAWGDEKGGLGAMVFKEPPELTKLCSLAKEEEEPKDVARSFLFIQVTYKMVTGVFARYISGIHNRIVVKIRFYETRREWISSCYDKSTALFIGDLIKMAVGKEHRYYVIDDGVKAFDYCHRLNMIATGGLSGKIGLWNPEAKTESKLVGHLDGHTGSITQLEVVEHLEMLVSVAENKDVRIYDLISQTLIQVFNRKAFVAVGLHPMNALYVNQITNRIILASKNLVFLDVRADDPEMMPLASHNRPINVILYNGLFRQLVSADQNSLICVWDVMTGRKTIEFIAHTTKVGVNEIGVEVTAMSFDPNGRRLMIAMQDGTVKLWNFNNGNCLQTLWKPDNKEVSCVAWARGRIMAGGWSHRILVYPDLTGQKKARGMRPPHQDDVICLDVFPPRYAASGCADGSIMIWSLETLHPLFKYYSYDPTQRAMNNFKLVIVQRPTKDKDESSSSSKKKWTSRTKNEEDEAEEGEATSTFEYIEGLPLGRHDSDVTVSSVIAMNHLYESSVALTATIQDHNEPKVGEIAASHLEPKSTSSDMHEEATQPSSDIKVDPPGGIPSIRLPDAHRNPDLSDTVNASVEVLLYLRVRPLQIGTAVLLSCLSNGWVLGWPMNSDGGQCLGRFFAISSTDETLGAASVTDDNEFLITGDSNGYIKVWDISHYLVADILCDEETDSLRWKVWRYFPFVVMRVSTNCVPRDRLHHLPLHLTQRCTRTAPPMTIQDELLDERPPHLINSFRGHLQGVSCLAACPVYKRRLLASGSSDLSIRLWTLEGQFLGIFGKPDIWTDLGTLVTAPIIRGPTLTELRAQRSKSVTLIVQRTLSMMSTAMHNRSAQIMSTETSSEGYVAKSRIKTVDERRPSLIAQGRRRSSGVRDDFDDWVNAAKKATATDEEDIEEDEEDEEYFDTFDVDEAIAACRTRRLIYQAAEDLAARVELLDPTKSVSRVEMVPLDSSTASLPVDIRRVASYTTLYVLESGLGTRSKTRWVKIWQAICWMKCYWESRRSGASMTDLMQDEAEMAAPFGNMLKGMIESHENSQQEALSKKNGTGNNNTASVQALLQKLGLPLLPPKRNKDAAAETPDGSDACRTGYFGRMPLTTSNILGTAYRRSLTHYRPWPPVVLPKPLELECQPYRELPLEPMGQMDACRIALNDRVNATCRVFHLPPLPCKWKNSNEKVDVCQLLGDTIARLGWRAAADGSLKRSIMPINSMNPHKSLQPPMYSCDIEALQRKFELDELKAMGEAGSNHSRISSRRSIRMSKQEPVLE